MLSISAHCRRNAQRTWDAPVDLNEHEIKTPSTSCEPATAARRKAIHFGSVRESRDAAPVRIAFTHILDAGLGF